MSNKNSDYYFLRGGGEMGALIRANDWSKTSLGDPADWPQSLRTMVAVMLDNPFGMYIAWGSEYIQLYNDGYRPILGATKHPQALGISTRETFSEIWHIIESMFDGVMKGNAVGFPDLMLPLNRNGFVEECYFDFSYSPIRKNDGEVGGVLVTVIETTEKKRATAALKESNERYISNMMQAPVAMCIFRGKNHVVEMANEQMLNLWGKQADQVMNKPIFEGLPEAKDQGLEELVDTVFNTGKKFVANERPVNLPRNGKVETTYINFIYDALKEADGTVSGIVATAIEVTEQVKARYKIEESDKRFRNTMQQAPVGITILRGAEYMVEMANDVYLQLVDRKEAEFVGNPLFASLPEVEEAVHSLLDNVINTGIPYHGNEVAIPINRYGKQDVFYFDFLYHPLKEEDGKISGVIVSVTEVTEKVETRKKIEESKEAIQESKIQLEFILECAKGGYWDLDLITGKSITSFRHDQCFGATEPIADWSYEKFLTYVYTEDRESEERKFKEAVATGCDWSIDCRVIWKDGSIHWIQSSGRNYRYIDGKPTRMLGMVREITEQKEVQKKIEESEQRFRLAIAGTNQTVFSQDKNLKHTWIYNPHPNFKAENIIGKKDEDMHAPASAAILTAIKQNVLDTGTAFNGDIAIEVGGQKENYTVHIEPIKDTDETITGIIGNAIDITERIKTQQKIEESEQRFQAAIQAVQGILWTNNGKGEMEGEQPGWASLTGQTYEEYQGYGWAQVVHPDDAKPTLDAWNEAVQERKTFIFEHRLKVKNGEWRYFSLRAIPLLNADGTLLQWVGVHTDITENKQAALALKANEEKLNIVIEASELGIWDLDLKTNKLSYSNRYREIMGYQHKEHITLEDTEKRVHPDYIQAKDEAIKKSRDTGMFYFAGKIIWEDNSMHWIESKGKVFYDEHKTPITIIGTTEDITKDRNHQKELEESEERFRNVADSAPVLIWMAGPDKLCYFFNKGWLNFTGRTMEQESGNGWAEGVHPDDLRKCLDVYISYFDKRAPFYMEYRLKRHDGEYRWLSDNGVPRFTSDGEFEGYIGACMDINNERVHQQALEESEEKFRLLADSMPQHIWTSDPQGNLNYYNQSVFDYSGLTLEQINKDGWIQIVHPDDRDGNIKQWVNAISTGKDFLFEHRFRKHDGEYRWQLSRAIPQRDENGKIQMWVGTSTDINEQKKAQEQFKVLADQAPMWVWLTDKEVNILYTNPEVLKFIGIAHYTEFAGKLWEQIVHPEDIAMVYKTFGEAASLQQSFSFEFRVQNAKTLQYEWFYIKAVPRLEDGEFTGFIGTGINTNEQKTFAKELEEKVITRTADLKASEEKFYNLFNLSPISKTLSDAISGKIVMVNDAFTKLFGYSRDEALGKSSAELGLLDLEEREIIISELKINGKIENREIWFIKNSGERFIALASAEVISMGEKKFFLSAFNDISEIKKAEQNIKLKNIELEKMNKELQSFAYISSHDLQEPLRKIQTFATRIIEKEEDNLSYYGKDMFNRMHDAAKRMQTLIQDLLAYSRTSTTERRFETIDLNEIIAEVKEELKEELKEKNAIIEANQLCDADIIPFQFRQLLHNLIGNSLKFSNPENPPHIQIKSEIANGIKFNNEKLSPQNKYCHITVSDNGIGFEQQYSEKIFEVFQRLHGKNEYNGTGIGLSIVKKIVENHHGIITAKGELNKGATFEIYIPAI